MHIENGTQEKKRWILKRWGLPKPGKSFMNAASDAVADGLRKYTQTQSLSEFVEAPTFANTTVKILNQFVDQSATVKSLIPNGLKEYAQTPTFANTTVKVLNEFAEQSPAITRMEITIRSILVAVVCGFVLLACRLE